MSMGFIDREGNRYGENFYQGNDYEGMVCCEHCGELYDEGETLYGWCQDCLAEKMNSDTLCMLFIAVDDSGSFKDGDVSVKEYCELNIEAFSEFLNDLKAGKYDGTMISTEYMEGAA